MNVRVGADPRLVTAASELEVLCRRWLFEPVLALDTEFVRTRTFFARLGLIQVSDGRGVYLLDAIALDLGPLQELFDRRSEVTVLHSCSEDLGIFTVVFGLLPRRVFDTQIAAALVGYGFSRSYQSLVEEILGIHLVKEETRSNWMARPLTSEQLRYAAGDVLHLPAVYGRLQEELVSRGRESWAEEEFARLGSLERYLVEPQDAYRRIKGGGTLDRRSLAILRELAAWRERQARKRDLARNFVIPDRSLVEIARRQPGRWKDLDAIRDLQPGAKRRYGERLLEIVAAAQELPTADLPAVQPRSRRVRGQKEILRALQEMVAETAAESGVAQEVLAQRRVLEDLLRRILVDGKRDLPPELEGWRENVIGRRLLQALEGHRSGLKLA